MRQRQIEATSVAVSMTMMMKRLGVRVLKEEEEDWR